jgi:sulfide dehydrogenase cytochrome subunit
MRPLFFVRPWAALLWLLCSAGPAAAQDAKSLQLQSLAATCANCHGTQGRAVEGAAVPGLAGLPASYLAEQMRAFKGGTRPATVMHQLAKGYNDAQIDALAAYFAQQKK